MLFILSILHTCTGGLAELAGLAGGGGVCIMSDESWIQEARYSGCAIVTQLLRGNIMQSTL